MESIFKWGKDFRKEKKKDKFLRSPLSECLSCSILSFIYGKIFVKRRKFHLILIVQHRRLNPFEIPQNKYAKRVRSLTFQSNPFSPKTIISRGFQNQKTSHLGGFLVFGGFSFIIFRSIPHRYLSIFFRQPNPKPPGRLFGFPKRP